MMHQTTHNVSNSTGLKKTEFFARNVRQTWQTTFGLRSMTFLPQVPIWVHLQVSMPKPYGRRPDWFTVKNQNRLLWVSERCCGLLFDGRVDYALLYLRQVYFSSCFFALAALTLKFWNRLVTALHNSKNLEANMYIKHWVNKWHHVTRYHVSQFGFDKWGTPPNMPNMSVSLFVRVLETSHLGASNACSSIIFLVDV